MPATTEEKEVIGELEAALTKFQAEFLTADTERMAALTAEVKDALSKAQSTAAEVAKMKADMRDFMQKNAPAPGTLLPGNVDQRSLGQKFAETPEYKAAVAAEFSSKGRLSLAVKGRFERKANTVISTGYPIIPQHVGVFAPPVLKLTVRDLLTVVSLTGTNAVEYVAATFNYAADYQLNEGDRKAQGDVAFVDHTAVVRTIAWYVKVSRQMLADVPYFSSVIDSQLLYGIALKEDNELLNGTGAAGHLLGLMPQATPAPAGVLSGNITSPLDTVLSAAAYLGSIGYVPTGIVLNPLDWASIQIMKNTMGAYLLGGPPVSFASPTMWGLPVVESINMAKGSFLVGAFPPNATLFDRESASVELSYENEDDFVRNLATIRAEERIALAVFRPTAFVKGALTFPTGTAAEAEHVSPQHTGNKK